MATIEEMDRRICDLRHVLQELIKEKGNLIDPLVIAVSQELDIVLNEYIDILKELDK